MIYVTRKAHFSASHRLFNPGFSDERNEEVFDKCNNPMGHGHNYELEVTVRGVPDPETGYVIDLKRLARIMDEHVVDRVDHKHLNFDVDFLGGIIPTAENIAVTFWKILEPRVREEIGERGALHSIRLFESANNFVEYFGDPVEIARYGAAMQEATA
jgi:6-pyruvoyltetrahydropterin/6-carboxytetrahydropterin synthase